MVRERSAKGDCSLGSESISVNRSWRMLTTPYVMPANAPAIGRQSNEYHEL